MKMLILTLLMTIGSVQQAFAETGSDNNDLFFTIKNDNKVAIGWKLNYSNQCITSKESEDSLSGGGRSVDISYKRKDTPECADGNTSIGITIKRNFDTLGSIYCTRNFVTNTTWKCTPSTTIEGRTQQFQFDTEPNGPGLKMTLYGYW